MLKPKGVRMTDTDLGKRIATAREAARLTQEQLGEALGLSKSVISRIEDGTRALKASEIDAIAARLGTSAQAFLFPDVYLEVYRAGDGDEAKQAPEAEWFRTFRIRYREFLSC